MRITSHTPRAYLVASAAAIMLLTGCGQVRRTITVTSDPPGALLRLNGREIGRTPVEVDFLYYGVYDVHLEAEGYEPLLTSGEAKPPWWDNIPIDLAAELTPGDKHAKIAWHYTLVPQDGDRTALVDRARQLREQLLSTTPPPAQPTATTPNSADSAPEPESEAAPASPTGS